MTRGWYCLISLLTTSACGPVPVQISKPSQEQTMRSSQEQTARQEQSADQQSQHQSESKQGTNSMPVIVICNQNNSQGASCATPRESSDLEGVVSNRLRRGAIK